MRHVTLQSGLLDDSLATLVDGVTDAVPRVASALIFLVVAVVLVKAVMAVVRWGLRRTLPQASGIYRQLLALVASLFLWFAVALTFLSLLGLGEIAASLGTAAGFLALGVSYALSGMLADAVAGIYLLQDPDFNVDDRVTAGDITGEVRAIELRKTRFDVDGDRVVRANSEIEKKWTQLGGGGGD
jgi:small-conductance mechanosensitive channel